MSDSLWRVCADCGDWIWPAEPVFTDALGRSPICAVCNVRRSLPPAQTRSPKETRRDS